MATNPAIAEIKERLNIVDVISSYLQLKKAGTNYKANCPFHHEKSASFVVSPTRQMWHCFGCGEGGDLITFVMKYENLEFKETLQILADRAGVKLPTYSLQNTEEEQKTERLYRANELAAVFYNETFKRSGLAEEARIYARKRGLKIETIDQWLIGFAPSGVNNRNTLETILKKKGYSKEELISAGLVSISDRGSYDRFFGRLTFPIWNTSGRICGFTARVLQSDSKAAKYVNSPETPIYHKSRIIFGLYQAKQEIRKKNELVVVEGNMDVISCHQAGFKNVIGSSGTAFTSEQLSIISRYTKNLKFAFDSDQAGALAAKRALDLALEIGMNVSIIKIEGAKDPDELIQKDPALFEKAISEAPPFLDYFFEQTFKDDERSISQKKAAADLLIPLINKLTDPIEISHYTKKLAFELNTSEKSIYDSILKEKSDKLKSNKTFGQIKSIALSHTSKGNTLNRTKSLEDRIIGYSLFNKDSNIYRDTTLSAISEEDFSDNDLKEIFQTIKRSEDKSLEALVKNITREELVELAKMALFVIESEYEMGTQADFAKEQTQVLKEFKLNSAKSKMESLIIEISKASKEKNSARLIELNQLFMELSKVIKENEL